MQTTSPDLLQVKDLHISFVNQYGPSVPVVEGISFKINAGETVCLVGESGSGKTVTALGIMGLLQSPPAKVGPGKIFFRGQDLLNLPPKSWPLLRGKEISMVFQDPLTSLNPVFTIGEQIAEALTVHGLYPPGMKKQTRAKVIDLLHQVGIADPETRMNNYPHQLSGGQRQRVMIAMAVACNPKLIIADEPTTALDVTIQAQILELFKKLQARQRSILYITHDLGVVAQVADRVYVMYAGLIMEQAPVTDLFTSPGHPYTHGLLASLPMLNKRDQALQSIPGAVPPPGQKPPGCPFHPRCQQAAAKCSKKLPDLLPVGREHFCRCWKWAKNK